MNIFQLFKRKKPIEPDFEETISSIYRHDKMVDKDKERDNLLVAIKKIEDQLISYGLNPDNPDTKKKSRLRKLSI